VHSELKEAGERREAAERPETPAGEAGFLTRAGEVAGTAILPFTLVLYLGLQGGGYDTVTRGEVAIGVWWLVLLGALVGVLPMRRFGAAAWTAIALLLGFAAWNAIGISWSESSERSVEELARVAAYLGVLLLALSAQGEAGLRRTVAAVAAGVALIGALALLSRLYPGWFPPNDPAELLPGTKNRLNYPLGYWNGLAALMAIGIPLLLVVATEARRLLTQAVATAALPVVMLAAFYTFSRGGALELAAAIAVLLLLYPRRFALVPSLFLAVIGSGIAILAATQRDALEDGIRGATYAQQGDEMLAVVLVVSAGVALMRVAFGLADRYSLGPRLAVSRRNALVGAGIALATFVVGAIALGAPAELSDRWEGFKDPQTAAGGAERFTSANGAGRYQQWGSALDAYSSEPLTGIGAGTYEFWWARDPGVEIDPSIPQFVRDGHSLYLESLAELGLPGLILIGGFVFWSLGVGARRARRGPLDRRGYFAAATAGGAAFATAAAVDWVWELPVLPVAFMLLAAALVAAPAAEPSPMHGAGDRDPRPAIRPRALLVGLAVLAITVVGINLASAVAIRNSQAEVRESDYSEALRLSRLAQDLQPYAATPTLQEALIREEAGDLAGAASRALEATTQESTNWRTWYTLARIEQKLGNAEAARTANDEARSLNPRSPLFASEAEAATPLRTSPGGDTDELE
jgi:hypothetical protein